MKRNEILKWICRFDKIIDDPNEDPKNKELCSRQKAEAEEELKRRDFRKEQYLKRNKIR